MRALFLLGLFFCGCVSMPEAPVSLWNQAPQLLRVEPESTDLNQDVKEWRLFFSEEIDPASLEADSVALIRNEVDLESQTPLSSFYENWKKGEWETVPVELSLSPDRKEITLKTTTALHEGELYSVVVTPMLSSIERVPFLIAGRRDVGLFQKTYRYAGSVSSEVSPVSTPGKNPSPGVSQPTGQPITQKQTHEPDLSPAPIKNPSVTEQKENPPPSSVLMIHELFYDATGSDTDGSVFVELYGSAGLDLSGVQVVFINGGDAKVYDTIRLPEGARIPEDGFYVIADSINGSPDKTRVENADLVDNFDPQNGPDAVQLFFAETSLGDALGYGDGIVDRLAENGQPCYEGEVAQDVEQGHSLERQSVGLDENNNGADFVDREVSTPGK